MEIPPRTVQHCNLPSILCIFLFWRIFNLILAGDVTASLAVPPVGSLAYETDQPVYHTLEACNYWHFPPAKVSVDPTLRYTWYAFLPVMGICLQCTT